MECWERLAQHLAWNHARLFPILAERRQKCAHDVESRPPGLLCRQVVKKGAESMGVDLHHAEAVGPLRDYQPDGLHAWVLI